MFVIGICGGTGSGKSTFAQSLEKHFNKLGVIKIISDSYYKNNSNLNLIKRSKINYDHPNSIDFKLLIKNLKTLKNNTKIKEPIYSYTSHKRLKKNKIIFPKKIIILDGLHIFCNDKIIELIDFGIYLDVDEKTRLKRRIKRDIISRGRSQEEVEKRFFSMCKPMHEKYIDPSKKYADLIIKSKTISIKKVINLISEKIIF
ncbi:MAG: uridine kinase [Flavobacteriaceae bacterium]|nr:uridine kinase [Flavobacteriaceae bacterium]|tara:strand:- start:2990 stop:3592 length:603 start_codon:yes stop_codon:yes gene_type:complete